jgi:hypothetical protein
MKQPVVKGRSGKDPHPTRDRAGSGFALTTEFRIRTRPRSAAKRKLGYLPEGAPEEECQPYLYGIDLFNHGYSLGGS